MSIGIFDIWFLFCIIHYLVEMQYFFLALKAWKMNKPWFIFHLNKSAFINVRLKLMEKNEGTRMSWEETVLRQFFSVLCVKNFVFDSRWVSYDATLCDIWRCLCIFKGHIHGFDETEIVEACNSYKISANILQKHSIIM